MVSQKGGHWVGTYGKKRVGVRVNCWVVGRADGFGERTGWWKGESGRERTCG